MNKILIIGPGAYGLCLAEVLQNNKQNEIYLLGKFKNKLDEIQNNQYKIFDLKINPVKNVYDNYKDCFKQKYNLIIFAVPSKELANLVLDVSAYINYNVLVINTSKGMKNDHEYWCDYFKKQNKHFKYAYLAGPSFAEDIIKKQKTICNLCCSNKYRFNKINTIFKCNYFNLVYLNQIKPYEFIGSLKNAVALAFGIINALTQSQNTINALFTQIMCELRLIINKKFICKNKIDLLSYCCLGDIMMCANSSQSRNYDYGYNLIKLSKSELENKYNNVTVEGIRTLLFLK
ncbi:MAG: hypothetical protein K2K73_01630, partial [Ureaplasma sp.]|nr:hypothetical protein [Ureaplasma sp.]